MNVYEAQLECESQVCTCPLVVKDTLGCMGNVFKRIQDVCYSSIVMIMDTSVANLTTFGLMGAASLPASKNNFIPMYN